MLIPGATLLSKAKAYADAADPNAGAWQADFFQPWLDDVYQGLFDHLLVLGALTPATLDTTLSYNPAVGYMTLTSANTRVIVDVFRVVGSRYEQLESAQHQTQYPNLDLAPPGFPGWDTLGPGYGAGWNPYLVRRSWAAFVQNDATIQLKVSPHDQPDTYLVRTVPDPNTAGGYEMPPVAARWVALEVATDALASEGVSNGALERKLEKAEDALNSYLESFQLRHMRKVTISGSPWARGGRLAGTGYWMRGG